MLISCWRVPIIYRHHTTDLTHINQLRSQPSKARGKGKPPCYVDLLLESAHHLQTPHHRPYTHKSAVVPAKWSQRKGETAMLCWSPAGDCHPQTVHSPEMSAQTLTCHHSFTSFTDFFNTITIIINIIIKFWSHLFYRSTTKKARQQNEVMSYKIITVLRNIYFLLICYALELKW